MLLVIAWLALQFLTAASDVAAASVTTGYDLTFVLDYLDQGDAVSAAQTVQQTVSPAVASGKMTHAKL